MHTQSSSSLRQLQQLPATYITLSSARAYLPANLEITSAALIGLNLFLDDMLYRLLETCDDVVRGHDGSTLEVLHALDDALADLLPPGLVCLIRGRSAELVAFAMLSQPARPRSRSVWGWKRSKQTPDAAAGEEPRSAVDRFPHLRQHCAMHMNGRAADRQWEFAIVVLTCEFLRSMALLSLKGAVLLVRQSQRTNIDVNEILSALSGDAQLAQLFNTTHACAWMAEMVQTLVTEARPDRELSNVHNYRVRKHRSLGNIHGHARADDMKEFISNPMASVTGSTGSHSPVIPISPGYPSAMKRRTSRYDADYTVAATSASSPRTARRGIISRVFRLSASSPKSPTSSTQRH